MAENEKQDLNERLKDKPFLVLVTSHWVSMLGAALVGTGLITWLFVLPLSFRREAQNPYVGTVVFIIVPMIFFLGLFLVPIGVWLAKRRLKHRVEAHIIDRKAARRRLLTFFGAVTVVNLIVGTQFTYRAVEHMESVQFCGQTCHVMKPEFMAHQDSAHARIECVECHVEPGATGWVKSKIAGSRQLFSVVTDDYHKPIPSAIETNRLVPSVETCEQCHWSEKFAAVRLRVITHFAEDEKNSETQSVLMMLIGGSRMHGIHGAHFGPGVQIRFAAEDSKRQKIPWVEYRNTKTNVTKTFLASSATSGSISKSPIYSMQCVDCHNRPAHTFELPERVVDNAMMIGFLPTSLPFLRKKGVELLKAVYTSNDDAAQKIPTALSEYYQNTYPETFAQHANDIHQVGKTLVEIYDRNVFPDLKVTWGTYPNNLGHTDFPGCFRCHDEDHFTSDKKTITQDCSTCHVPLAMDESSPEVLSTLGLTETLTSIKKK